MTSRIQAGSNTLTLITTAQTGEENAYTIFFRDENDFSAELDQMAYLLEDTTLIRIAYSTPEEISFIAPVWDNFMEKTTDFSPYEVTFPKSFFAAAGGPSMNGWGSVVSEVEPQTKEAEPFFSLPLTPKDKNNIRILLTDLSEKNYLQLLMDKSGMNRKGDRVKVVHPMRFLGYILYDPFLHKCLKVIEKDSIIYGEFTAGFVNHMEEEAAKEDLTIYAPGFAELLQVNVEMVTNSIKNKKYEDLIKKIL